MGGIANLVSPPAPIRHHSARLRHRPPITNLHIARPCSSLTTLTRRSCTPSLTQTSPLTSRGEGSKLGAGRYDYGSCSDAVLSTSSGDDDVPFGGGSGGGGGGGSGGGGNAGNSDEDNMSQLAVPLQQLQLKRESLRLHETLQILTLRDHQITRKLLAELEKVAVVFRNMIGFLTSIPHDTVLRAMGAVLENHECITLAGDSSSSMVHDNLQCTSSTDPSSSMAVVSCPMDADGIHSSDDNEYNESIRPVLNCHSSFENYVATNMGPRSSHVMRNREATIPRRPMDTSSGGNAFEENEIKKKGFLATINSVTMLLSMISLPLALATYAYPFAPKASLSLGDPWMQVITAGSTIAFITSITLACLGFRLKGRKSIQGAGFETVKWLLLLQPLFLGTAICIFLHFALKLSKAFVWPIGAIMYIAILSLWALNYYVDHPEIMEGTRNDIVEDGPFSSPV